MLANLWHQIEEELTVKLAKLTLGTEEIRLAVRLPGELDIDRLVKLAPEDNQAAVFVRGVKELVSSGALPWPRCDVIVGLRERAAKEDLHLDFEDDRITVRWD